MNTPTPYNNDKQDLQPLRDVFNRNGLNYSQIVGDESTVVSMSLEDFNQALTELAQLQTIAENNARIDEVEYIMTLEDGSMGDATANVSLSALEDRLTTLTNKDKSEGDDEESI